MPKGHGGGRDWVPVGSSPSEPKVDPQRTTTGGNAGDTGTGGPTWQLHLPPRHRQVLQRFFGNQEKR
ncbi:MAG: hypothetical protein IPK26_06705 [Planctomycetes bacterium]|nr:hypothetical protein [Planctomycetota bacterium]